MNQIKLFQVILFLVFILTSCSKDQDALVSQEHKGPAPSLQWSDCLTNRIANTQSKSVLYSYEHTTEQENVMKASDYLSLALVQVLENNPSIIQNFYSYVQNHYSSTEEAYFTFDDYCQTNPGDCGVINTYLEGIIPGGGGLATLESMMVYDEAYKPGLHFPNYEVANWSLFPIISPAIDVDDDLYSQTQEDLYLSYYKASDSSVVEEIVLNLDLMDLDECFRPIVVGTHISVLPATGSVIDCNDCNKTSDFGTLFSFWEFKIKNLHERWGAAEMAILASHLAIDGSAGNYKLVAAVSDHVEKIKRKDKGKLLYRWNQLIDGPMQTFPYAGYPEIAICNTGFNMVEVGGVFNSPKLAFVIVAPDGQIFTRKVSRKFTSDWYAFNPGQDDWDFICDHQGQWNTKWIINQNAEFRIWRLD